MMYQAYQAQSDLMWPLRTLAKLSMPMLQDPMFANLGLGAMQASSRQMAAACKVLELAEVTHKRPPWRIDSVLSKGEALPVTEEVVLTTPFATLLRFRKPGAAAQPKVLVVAPMSGHFATLLRDTVRTVLQDHDVYVTDWHNVRDVPLAAGRFGLDEYTAHIIEFLAAMGPNANVIAVCQPCVAALAAVALMSEDQHPATPASLTLMAGPIDCRISPTEVNKLATTKPIEWFEKNLISSVPWRHGGGGRRIDLAAIRRTALLTIEGERDDICSVGQTLAAQDLCTGLRPYLRNHYVQAGVGHYGVFSGKRWQNHIYPIVRDVIHVSQ